MHSHAGAWERTKKGLITYFMLLIAKGQYREMTKYFADPESKRKEKLKPLYYALLHYTGDKDYARCPPELGEPVAEIVEKIRCMARDYA